MLEELNKNILTIRNNLMSKEARLKLCQLRKDGKFIDVRLSTETSKISAHKLVLSLYSPYFEKMFTSQFSEANQDEIVLHDIDSKATESLINYFYTGYLQIGHNNLEAMLRAVDVFLLQDVRAAIERFLLKTLAVDNCIEFKYLADLYGFKELFKNATMFFARNFESVIKDCDLNLVNFQNLIEVLASDCLEVASEDFVLETIAKWVECDTNEREPRIGELLQYVNKCELTSNIVNNVNNQALRHEILTHTSETLDVPEKRRQRNPNQWIVAVGLDSKVLEYLDLDHLEQGWNTLTEIPGMRYGFNGAAIATYKDLIFITGGVGKGAILKAVNRFLIFNLRTNSWTEGPSLQNARKSHACGIINDRLVVVGGTLEQNPVLTSEFIKLDEIRSGKWKAMISLDSWHNGSNVCQIGESQAILISGYGCNNDKLLDLNRNTLEALALNGTVGLNRDHPGVASDEKNNIFVAGGSVDQNAVGIVEKYDISSRSWTELENMKMARVNPGLVFARDKLFAIGGKNSKQTTENYDFEKNQWSLMEGLALNSENDEYLAIVVNFQK